MELQFPFVVDHSTPKSVLMSHVLSSIPKKTVKAIFKKIVLPTDRKQMFDFLHVMCKKRLLKRHIQKYIFDSPPESSESCENQRDGNNINHKKMKESDRDDIL